MTRSYDQGQQCLQFHVTGHEKWVDKATPENPAKKRPWYGNTHHFSQQIRSKKPSGRNIWATVWDHKVVHLLVICRHGDTVIAECYGGKLTRLRRTITCKRSGLLRQGVVILHNNARRHSAVQTCDWLWHYGWEFMDHNPEFATSGFAFRWIT